MKGSVIISAVLCPLLLVAGTSAQASSRPETAVAEATHGAGFWSSAPALLAAGLQATPAPSVPPITPAPVQPITTAPIQPNAATAAQPITNAPAQPITDTPAQPITAGTCSAEHDRTEPQSTDHYRTGRRFSAMDDSRPADLPDPHSFHSHLHDAVCAAADCLSFSQASARAFRPRRPTRPSSACRSS